jgi:hypothetical protein
MTENDSVTLKITCCDSCPHLRQTRHRNSDSSDLEFDWKCALNNMLHITYHAWNGGKEPIPEWCPLRDSTSGTAS